MDSGVLKQIAQLRHMTVGQLQAKHCEVFGERSRSHHKDYLYRRIAWRLQALAEGDLSDRARRRALEIANDADLRVRAPKSRLEADAKERTTITAINFLRDRRLPKPGTLLSREFKGEMHVVRVLDEGFEYEGRRSTSLSKIATEIAGSRWNGFTFFGLAGSRESPVA
jgi:hypothetical protein